jgi:hypothetical protein
MEKICFFIRSISLIMGLTACSGLNQEVIQQDVELFEEINDDIQKIMNSRPVDSNPPDITNSHFDACKRSWRFVA